MKRRYRRVAIAWVWTAMLTSALSCSGDDAVNAPPPPVVASVQSGAGQRGPAGKPLPRPVVITVVNDAGRAMRGVKVDWAVQDSDIVTPAHSITDGNGFATAEWTLGPVPGEHTVIASVAGYGTVQVKASADPVPLVLNDVHLLGLQTPDGSGQTVHPDYLSVDTDGPLHGIFLGITPYPFGNPSYENPSVYTSLDRVHWRAPTAASNPVVKPGYGYLSDPDIVFNPETNELWLYYRQVDVLNEIKLLRSSDGVQWSEPELVLSGFSHTIVSPAVVRRAANDWLMWSVNGQSGCESPDTWIELRHSADGRHWSLPQKLGLAQQGMKPWHIDVQWVPERNEYWALYNVKPSDGCKTPALFLATSPDGVTWTTYPSPVLLRGEIPYLSDVVYRSTFRYRADIDAITFWFSGATYTQSRYDWRSVVQRRGREAVFEAMSRQPTSVTMRNLRRRVPPLIDPP